MPNLHLNERDEVQQILGNPPGSILRWGITVVALSVTVFFVLSYLIKYPDIIKAPVILLTDNPPIRVVAKANGELVDLTVAEKTFVKKEAVLGEIRNTANRADILTLEKTLSLIENTASYKGFYTINLPKQPVLGDLQTIYANFAQQFNNFVYLTKQPTVAQKVEALRKQIINTQKLIETQKGQIGILKQEQDIIQKNVKRSQDLFAKGGISEREKEQSEGQLLQVQRQVKNANVAIINNEISINQLTASILELQQGKQDQDLTEFIKIKANARNLYGEIQKWKETFLLVAPIDGQVTMTRIWSNNQFIKAGEEVMTIVPDSTTGGTIIGKAMLPTDRAGKVKKGTVANIRFAGYPYQEFGVVEAKIKNISLVPIQMGEVSVYPTDLELPNKLKTTYNKSITFSQEMQGFAHIITEDKRIIHRVFDKLNSLIRNR